MNDVLHEVEAEREAQDRKWGVQNHWPGRYFNILAEEFGEVAKEVVEYEAAPTDRDKQFRLARMRTELIQTAAVAVAMVECLDRGTFGS